MWKLFTQIDIPLAKAVSRFFVCFVFPKEMQCHKQEQCVTVPLSFIVMSPLNFLFYFITKRSVHEGCYLYSKIYSLYIPGLFLSIIIKMMMSVFKNLRNMHCQLYQ